MVLMPAKVIMLSIRGTEAALLMVIWRPTAAWVSRLETPGERFTSVREPGNKSDPVKERRKAVTSAAVWSLVTLKASCMKRTRVSTLPSWENPKPARLLVRVRSMPNLSKTFRNEGTLKGSSEERSSSIIAI